MVLANPTYMLFWPTLSTTSITHTMLGKREKSYHTYTHTQTHAHLQMHTYNAHLQSVMCRSGSLSCTIWYGYGMVRYG